MKKIRLFLSLSAFVIAIGVTAASELSARSNVAAITGYEFIPASGNIPAKCKEWADACNTQGIVACTVTGASSVLRAHSDPSTATPCGIELTKLP